MNTNSRMLSKIYGLFSLRQVTDAETVTFLATPLAKVSLHFLAQTVTASVHKRALSPPEPGGDSTHRDGQGAQRQKREEAGWLPLSF